MKRYNLLGAGAMRRHARGGWVRYEDAKTELDATTAVATEFLLNGTGRVDWGAVPAAASVGWGYYLDHEWIGESAEHVVRALARKMAAEAAGGGVT